MLELIIIFGAFEWLIHILGRKYENKIRQATSLEEGLEYRRKLKRLKIGLAIISIVLYVGIYIFLHHDSAFWLSDGGKNIIVLLFLYLIKGGWKKLKGNVSFKSKEDFLKKNTQFALFLRGFENDVYDINLCDFKGKFSEYHFIEELKVYIPVCAVGMTKESDAPWGAERIYLDDLSWKEDVAELMTMAQYIFILMNDRPSCIWEIEQSANMLRKTYFIIDDEIKYNSIRDKLMPHIEFPDIQKLEINLPFCLRFVDIPIRIFPNDVISRNMDRVVNIMTEFSNSQRAYEKLFEKLFSKGSEDNCDGLRLVMRAVLKLFIIFILSCINFFIINKLLTFLDANEIIWNVLLLFCAYILDILVYFRIKRIKRKKENATNIYIL